MLPRRKTKIQLHSVTVSSAGAEFLYHQRPILFTNGRITAIRNAAKPLSAVTTPAAAHRPPDRRPADCVRRSARRAFR
ncbi:hypothetical protein CXB36_02470 [Pseudomonas syringae pv. syringae]|uniref:Uncharacterized protein n=1 Tax=Pseudomonas syringae UB303 TaxID=1357287 RepID=A0AAJ4B3E7_PSESX|nr:hypothetical protein BKC06_019560 [Pseudomonas syringae pv. syringae]MCF4984537.1 hypothetical protein [Pseudomonas syringae]QGG77332.1 hypothetical protein N028_19020 [Pseudomonas syringae USA011]QHF09567.1 hypothetical protein N026_19705 [Pseudomonas syringae UB303]MCF5028517.1 hypothetical protein [Pseudomonas syringae]